MIALLWGSCDLNYEASRPGLEDDCTNQGEISRLADVFNSVFLVIGGLLTHTRVSDYLIGPWCSGVTGKIFLSKPARNYDGWNLRRVMGTKQLTRALVGRTLAVYGYEQITN